MLLHLPLSHPSINYSAQGSAGTACYRVPAQCNPCVHMVGAIDVVGAMHATRITG
jgi:hypothetical protein